MSSIYFKGVKLLERQPKLIKFPVDLITQIEKYQKENCLSSFSAAVYELIRRGLASTQKRK